VWSLCFCLRVQGRQWRCFSAVSRGIAGSIRCLEGSACNRSVVSSSLEYRSERDFVSPRLRIPYELFLGISEHVTYFWETLL
jgi:hypothetical protein